jgi:hypothetical protein
MSVTLSRVLENRDNETRRGGTGSDGFVNSRFVFQAPGFHSEPRSGSSGKTKPQAARKNACGDPHDNRRAAPCHFVQWLRPEKTPVAHRIEIRDAPARQCPGGFPAPMASVAADDSNRPRRQLL